MLAKSEKQGTNTIVQDEKLGFRMTSSTLPACTIVVSSLNQVSTLCATLESIFAQEQAKIECIVVDSSTADAGPELIEKYNGQLTFERVPESEHAAAVTN